MLSNIKPKYPPKDSVPTVVAMITPPRPNPKKIETIITVPSPKSFPNNTSTRLIGYDKTTYNAPLSASPDIVPNPKIIAINGISIDEILTSPNTVFCILPKVLPPV